MLSILKYKKIKYTFETLNLTDFSKYRETYEINDGGLLIVNKSIINKERKIIKQEPKSYFVFNFEIIEQFICELWKIISDFDESTEKICDNSSGTLEISYIDNIMKIKVDRSLSNGNKSVGDLINILLKNATKIFVD